MRPFFEMTNTPFRNDIHVDALYISSDMSEYCHVLSMQ